MNRDLIPKFALPVALIILCIVGIANAATTYTEVGWFLQGNGPQVAASSLDDCRAKVREIPDPIKQRTTYCALQIVTKVEPDKPVPPVPEPPKPPTGIPNASNTGPLTKDLRPISGNQTISKGVLENFVLTGGQINVTGPDVVIRNFRIVGGMKVPYGIVATDPKVKGLLVEHGEITGVTNIAIYGHDMTVKRVYVHELGADGFRPTGNSTLIENYCEKIGRPGAHADCVQMLIGENVSFIRNHFYLPYNDPNWMNSACFMIQVDKGPVRNILLDSNVCYGGDFGAQTTGGVQDLSVRNNVFSRKGEAEYGPYAENVVKAAGSNLCGNKYSDGTLIPGNVACK